MNEPNRGFEQQNWMRCDLAGPEVNQQELIAIALRHLQLYRPADSSTPVSCVTFFASDAITPYDRWVVLFETRPGCEPSYSAIEVLPPDMTPQLRRVI